MFVNCSYIVSFVVKSPSGGENPWKQHLRIQGCHFLKSALNLDLTLSDDGECRTFFDSPRNYWFRCFLRRVMVIFRQQKNFGPNVIYVLRVDSWVSLPPHSSWRLQLRLRLFTAFVVKFFAAVTLYANLYRPVCIKPFSASLAWSSLSSSISLMSLRKWD